MATVLTWLEQTVATETRIQEIAEACERISALVAGAKLYAHLDRGEYQCADLHELLRGTLVMYGDSIAMPGKGRPITLAKELDERIPEIHCYPAELNQAWTVLLDNALAAIRGRGTLTIRTRSDGDSWVRVDIDDGGTDIPTDAGLAPARRIVVEQHHGTLAPRCRPGDPLFTVRLPTRAPAPETAGR
jgi:signal transduction histidine kinase